MALTQLKTSGIADDAVTTDKLANAINTERTANTAKVSLGADSVTGAKIADDAVGAEHIEVLDSHLQLTDNSNIKLGTGDDLLIYHNGSDSYVKNSTGDLYIRDTNGNVYIQPKTDENGIKCIADGAVELYHDNVKRVATNSGSYNGAIIHGAAANTSIAMQTETTTRGYLYANSSDEVGFLDAGGDWAIKHTNDNATKFYVQTNHKATIDADGLKFGTDTAAANALNDYEEGSWTMTAHAGVDSITQGASNQRYTKIGNVVTIVGEVNGLTNPTSSSLNIAGLPYNVANGREGSGPAFSNNVDFPSGYNGPTMYTWANTDRIRVYVSADGGGWHPLSGDEIGSNGSVIFTASYLTS